MMTFRIDHDHKSTALASEPQVRIRQVPEQVRPAKKLPGPRVVEISTAVSGQKPASKESSGKIARSAARSRAPSARAHRPRPRRANVASTWWNSAHGSTGCTQANLVATGGAGRFYCFAIN